MWVYKSLSFEEDKMVKKEREGEKVPELAVVFGFGFSH